MPKRATDETAGDAPAVQMMEPDALKPYENNPRFNDGAVEFVANSIKTFGFRQPVLVDKDMVVIAGHTRIKAAKKLGLAKIPVIVADDLPPEKVAALRLADNKTAELAAWDETALQEELDAIAGLELDFKMEDFGFADLSDPTKDIEENDVTEEDDAFSEDNENAIIHLPVPKRLKMPIEGYRHANGDEKIIAAILEVAGIEDPGAGAEE